MLPLKGCGLISSVWLCLCQEQWDGKLIFTWLPSTLNVFLDICHLCWGEVPSDNTSQLCRLLLASAEGQQTSS
jgi:hypothetical protein